MKKLNLYLCFLCIAFAPAMSSGSGYDVMCSIDINNPCTGIKEQTECNNKASCVFNSVTGCKQCPGGEYKSGSTCTSCPKETVTTPSRENKSYQYTSCEGATSKNNCYHNCDKYCTSMKTTNGTWSLDTSQYTNTGPMGVQIPAAVYWDAPVTKCKCKLTCKNANDYCSNDGENPNGYHEEGSYSVSQNMVFYKCQPNWQKYTSGTDTGFKYWDTSQVQANWSTGYITKCGTERHFNPNTVKTTPKCDKQYGTCESNIQKCDANFLGDCYVSYANDNRDVAVHGSISTTGQLEWAGDNTTDKWTVSSGECKCRVDNVPIMECVGSVPNRKCKEIGKKQVELSYTGNGRKGASNDILWGNAKDKVTSCVAGYYANKDHTACIPVEDGYYSPVDSLERKDCKVDPYSGNKDNYYTYSDGLRSAQTNCYVKCSERADYLMNDKGGDSLNGKWRWEGTEDDKRYAGSLNFPCNEDLRLHCNENYYGYGTGETRKCNLCSNLTDSIGQPGYWNKSDGGTGDQTQCYAQCSDKTPPATNGKFTATTLTVRYNAITKAKCEYTLACNEGYYRKNDGKNCDPCPAGSTSDKGADAITKCYMTGGPDGTEFCDNHGCFNLPTSVKIFYVGN